MKRRITSYENEKNYIPDGVQHIDRVHIDIDYILIELWFLHSFLRQELW